MKLKSSVNRNSSYTPCRWTPDSSDHNTETTKNPLKSKHFSKSLGKKYMRIDQPLFPTIKSRSEEKIIIKRTKLKAPTIYSPEIPSLVLPSIKKDLSFLKNLKMIRKKAKKNPNPTSLPQSAINFIVSSMQSHFNFSLAAKPSILRNQ